jgi:hypothetical protein
LTELSRRNIVSTAFYLKGGVALYCKECHKQSPDNFINCAYCGAKLDQPKKKQPQRFNKKTDIKINFSFRFIVKVLVVISALLTVVAVFTATFVGSKPEKVVKNFVKSIQESNSKLYYALYDDNIIRYKTDKRYFGEDETFKQTILAMEESDKFYTEKCGEGYKLNYSITANRTLDETELERFNLMLENSFGYVEFPSRVDVLSIDVIATGKEGEYKTVYNDFWCMKIKGHWYKVDKTIYAEYLKSESVS